MTSKQQIHGHFLQLLQDKIDVFRDRISALTDDAKNDAKGSAGDKHETALSMMHIEQEKTNYKLQEFLAQFEILRKIDSRVITTKIVLGSLIQVNKIWLYVSVALPKSTINNESIFAISQDSPLAKKMLGQIGLGFIFGK